MIKNLIDSALWFSILVSLAALWCIVLKCFYHGNEENKDHVYPPGPPQDFLIGNLRQVPKNNFGATFCEWGRRYGPVVHVKLPGMSMVIVNSHEVAQDILSKRTHTTSSRRMGYMIQELMGWKWGLPFMDPGQTHSNQREMLRKGIGPQRIWNHSPSIESITAKLMLKLRKVRGNPHPLILDAMGRLMLEVAYGTEITNDIGDKLVSWNIEAMKLVNDAFLEFWIVDIFPFLRFIPSWIPGVTFRKIATRSSWLSHQLRYKAFEKAEELYKSGRLGHSLATDLLEEFGPVDDTRDTLGLLCGAGIDTTSASIIAFLRVMFLFPHIAEKVHEEIEEVTSGQRLPQVADRPNLRFTEAVWKEAWRWQPFATLGIPHVNTQDEIVNGHLIPKGSLININTGFMLTNPDVWGDPDVFRPERFLEAGAEHLPNPATIVFGYGIRVCPGKYLADRSGFHIATTTIALYKLMPLEGATIPDPSSIKYTDNVTRVPIGFKYQFVPRDDNAQDLLKAISLSD